MSKDKPLEEVLREMYPPMHIVATVKTMSDLDQLFGPLTPENPVKWGVLKALQHAEGRPVEICIRHAVE